MKQKEKERNEVNERFRMREKEKEALKVEEEFIDLKIKQLSDMVNISNANILMIL